ncbi:MAG: response regulator transcription factor [Bacteroidetes bacterium]|nr:response regulator transcription factor [Bacteroidota bacterium]
MEKVSILLVEDHKLIRETWALLLQSNPRFQVIGETDNIDQALQICREKHPAIVLMDVNMSPVNGFEATQLIRKYIPGTKVIGVSMHSMPAFAQRMIRSGASGYVTKNSSKEELFEALLEVQKGNKYICREVKNILSQQKLEMTEESAPDLNNLSRREFEVIQLIKSGLSSKEIAQQLDLSLKTVEVHRYNILKKLHLKNTAALVNFINSQGL